MLRGLRSLDIILSFEHFATYLIVTLNVEGTYGLGALLNLFELDLIFRFYLFVFLDDRSGKLH